MSQCCDKFTLDDIPDSFQMWQGLRGPYFTPHVAENGDLNWSNNGQLQNPETVNIKGPPGEPGPGVPAGGTTGQLLAKTSDEDFDTEWIDQPEMDAGHVSYDSTEAYDDGTVGKELTTINSALSSLSAVTEIIDTASGAIASFPDGAGLPMRSLVAQIEPQQDLHGYESPWVGGSGKNKLPTVLSNIKSSNTSGTWSGNKYTLNGIEFAVNTDADGNVTDITANGTASANADIYIIGTGASGYVSAGITSGSYVFSGNPTSNSTATMFIVRSGGTIDCNVYDTNEKPVTIDDTTTYRIFIRINSGKQVSSAKFQPMVRLSTVSDATFAPYSNECPITGWTGLSGSVAGKNLLPNKKYQRGTNCVYLGQDVDHNYFPIHLKAGTYTLACNNAVKASLNYKISDGSTVQIHSSRVNNYDKFTLEKDGDYQFWLYNGEGISPSDVTEFQLEIGETKTAYEAYVTPNPITVSWQTEAGTVYGGTVDVVSGVLTADTEIFVLDGSQSNFIVTAYTDYSGVRWRGYESVGTANPKLWSDKFKSASPSGGALSAAWGGSSVVRMNFGLPTTVTTATEAQAWFTANPTTVVASIASPQTYQLTPQQINTLLGNNTVFVDTGSVSVTYQASIKGYIDKVLAS